MTTKPTIKDGLAGIGAFLLIIAAFCLILVTLPSKEPSYKTEFMEICTKLGGTTVYDGQRYVCLK